MITVGGENLIDYVQTALDGELPVYKAIPGGSCYNVSIAVARQDQPVTYVTPISVDSLGDILVDRLLADGVKIGSPRSHAPTSLAVVSLSEGQPSYQFYRNGTAERDISAQHLDTSIHTLTKIFHIGSLSLIDGEDANLWECKFKELYQKGVITSLDPNARPLVVNARKPYIKRLRRMAKHTCVLKLSDEDLEYLCPNLSHEESVEELFANSSAQLMILTKGINGATVRTPQHQFNVSAVSAEPFKDAVGAGDTFMGTILVELYRRNLKAENIGRLSLENLQRIVGRATRAAAVNCQFSGCNPPYARDLKC